MMKGYFDENYDANWVVPIADKKGKYLNLQKGRKHFAGHKYSSEKKEFQVQKLMWAQQSDYPGKIIVLEEIVWFNKRTEFRMVTTQLLETATGGGNML